VVLSFLDSEDFLNFVLINRTTSRVLLDKNPLYCKHIIFPLAMFFDLHKKGIGEWYSISDNYRDNLCRRSERPHFNYVYYLTDTIERYNSFHFDIYDSKDVCPNFIRIADDCMYCGMPSIDIFENKCCKYCLGGETARCWDCLVLGRFDVKPVCCIC